MKKKNRIIYYATKILYSVDVFLGKKEIDISNYEISFKQLPKAFHQYKILQISDLHNKKFGHNNLEFIQAIHKINPDCIVLTGDMVSRTDIDGSSLLYIIKQLNNQYPVFYIFGNHEIDLIRYKEKWFEDFITDLKNLHVSILRNEKISITKDKQTINVYGYEIPKKNYIRNKPYKTIQLEFSSEFKHLDKNKVNILLAHNPAYFATFEKIGYNLILAGHVHGGMVRLPIVGGVFSSDMTLFPKYDEGKYQINNSILLVSRGLAGIRIFNPPHLIVVSLMCS